MSSTTFHAPAGRALFVCLLALALLGCDAATVALINELEPGDDVQAAVDEAQDGDVIVLLPGIHRGPLVLGGRRITLRGSATDPQTVAETILDAERRGSAVRADLTGSGTTGLVIEGLTIRGGLDDHGGGVRITGAGSARVELRALSIEGNEALGNGGGVLIEGARPLDQTALDSASATRIENVSLTGNLAAGDGGGLYLEDVAGAELTEVSATGNLAGRNGGAVAQVDSAEIVVGFFDADSNAAREGGGAYFERTVDAGPFEVLPTWLTMQGGQARGNMAGIQGGAIDTSVSTVVLDGVHLLDNSAGSENWSAPMFTGEHAAELQASAEAGGLVSVTFDDGRGGGVYVTSTVSTITPPDELRQRLRFSGALGRPAVVSTCETTLQIEGNVAGEGAGVYLDWLPDSLTAGHDASFDCVELVGNVAADASAAIVIDSHWSFVDTEGAALDDVGPRVEYLDNTPQDVLWLEAGGDVRCGDDPILDDVAGISQTIFGDPTVLCSAVQLTGEARTVTHLSGLGSQAVLEDHTGIYAHGVFQVSLSLDDSLRGFTGSSAPYRCQSSGAGPGICTFRLDAVGPGDYTVAILVARGAIPFESESAPLIEYGFAFEGDGDASTGFEPAEEPAHYAFGTDAWVMAARHPASGWTLRAMQEGTGDTEVPSDVFGGGAIVGNTIVLFFNHAYAGAGAGWRSWIFEHQGDRGYDNPWAGDVTPPPGAPLGE